MKLKITLAILLTNILFSYSQQIDNGYAPYITDWTQPMLSGVYGAANAIGRTPDNSLAWQHLFVIRHGNPANNSQLQIGSSFSSNDRLFFRKIAGDLTPQNPEWIELATRGTNTFSGNQFVNGAILSSISNDTGGHIQLINPTKNGSGVASTWRIYNMTGGYGNSLQFWAYDDLSCAGGMCNNRFTIMDNGKVGIGTANPTSMLTVAGNIASREVKVTVDAGADFVFDDTYNLPSLESVDKFIKENKHLPEIASAAEMKKDGINLSEMNIKLLQKIEELTLYMIEMKNENEKQKILIEEQDRKILNLDQKVNKLLKEK